MIKSEPSWHDKPTEYGWWWCHKTQRWELAPYDHMLYGCGPWYGPWKPPQLSQVRNVGCVLSVGEIQSLQPDGSNNAG